MLMRFDPFRELDRLEELAARSASQPRPVAMPMDAFQEGDRFIVRFDLPGVDLSSIDLTVDKNVLNVRAERRWQPAEGQEVLIAERAQGAFTRQLFLGDTLDAQGVQASYEQGVLTLTIPMVEQAKPRKVEVTAGAGDEQPMEPAIDARASEPSLDSNAMANSS